jgi:hypothetical protein
MSYQERRALVAIVGTILISGGYAAWMLPQQPVGDAYSPELFRFWGSYFLVLIVVSIIVRILIAIAFSIINVIATHEKEPGLSDERDRLIEMRAYRNGFFIFILGFVLAMVTLAAGQPPATMFLLLLLAGIASELVSDVSEFIFYRRGF